MHDDPNRLDRIENKLDRALDVLTEVRVTLATNTSILAEHQRRSLALENIVEVLRSRPQKPRASTYVSWPNVGKLAGAIAGGLGALAAILKALNKI